ncbi:hypothetical protein TNCV_1639331 [Trichonephila clavipes]|nr:hypothetical protein TNCV_1639331 [Trichonephila clavipes]
MKSEDKETDSYDPEILERAERSPMQTFKLDRYSIQMPPLKFVFPSMGLVCEDMEPPLDRLTGIGRRKDGLSLNVQKGKRTIELLWVQ